MPNLKEKYVQNFEESNNFVNEEEENNEEIPTNTTKSFILGIGASTFLGLMNGSMLVPSELTPEEYQGIEYVISFSIGVAIVTIVLAPIIFVIQWLRGKGYPKFHFKVAVIPGILSGLIWNMGNICSIYATLYLGLTIGFPLTQMALLVGGLWGMILFKEITRIPAIICFFLFAFVLLGGAVLLSIYG